MPFKISYFSEFRFFSAPAPSLAAFPRSFYDVHRDHLIVYSITMITVENSGIHGLVYLILNNTIRREVFKLFKLDTKLGAVAPITVSLPFKN